MNSTIQLPGRNGQQAWDKQNWNQGQKSQKKVHLKDTVQGFPGGTVVENLSGNAGDMGSSPGLGRSHMPWSNQAHEPQLLSLLIWSLCSATREAVIVRDLHTAMKSDPRLPQLEKALAQKRRPNTAKNKLINFKKRHCELTNNTYQPFFIFIKSLFIFIFFLSSFQFFFSFLIYFLFFLFLEKSFLFFIPMQDSQNTGKLKENI